MPYKLELSTWLVSIGGGLFQPFPLWINPLTFEAMTLEGYVWWETIYWRCRSYISFDIFIYSAFILPLYLSFQPLILTTVNKGMFECLMMFFLSAACFSRKKRPQSLPNICQTIFTPPQMFSSPLLYVEIDGLVTDSVKSCIRYRLLDESS